MRNAPIPNRRRRARARSRRMAIDPYVVTSTTLTREELLRARGWNGKRLPASVRVPKAA